MFSAMKQPISYVRILLLLALLIVLPLQAQQDTDTHTVAFDNISLTYGTVIADRARIWTQEGTPVIEAGPGFSDATAIFFQLYSEPDPALDGRPFPANIRVYRTADLAHYDFMHEIVLDLSTLLTERPELSTFYEYDNRLPYLPILTHGQIIRARASYVDGTNLAGIAYVTAVQAAAEPLLSDTVFYTIQALSSDGEYYVSADFALTVDVFPAEFPADYDIDTFSANLDAYLAESTTMLNDADMSAFTPALPLLESVVQSIVFGMEYATMPSFAADNGGTLVYDDGTGIVTDLITADAISDITWNADGNQIAVVLQTRVPGQNDVWELGYVDVSAMPIETGILQTNRPSVGYPVSWMRDGRLLFAAENPQTNPETGLNDKVDLFATVPGVTPELLGTLSPFGGECGGGSDQPADWRYWSEIGGMGIFLTLADTPFGIVHSTDCAGSLLGLLDPTTGESTLIAENLDKAVVSPDGTQVTGIARDYTTEPLTSALVVYDLATGTSRTIATEAEPSLVAWNLDGTALYYATRTFDRNLVETMPQVVIERFTDALGYEMESIPAYTVTVYHVSLADGNTSVVYTGDAYAIGRIIETSDAVFISRVPNMMNWIERLAIGNIPAHDRDASLEAVEAEVMMIDRAGTVFGQESFVGYFEQFTPFVSR